MTRRLSLAANTSSSFATDNWRNRCIDFREHKFCIDAQYVNRHLHAYAFQPSNVRTFMLAALLTLCSGQCLTVAAFCVLNFIHKGAVLLYTCILVETLKLKTQQGKEEIFVTGRGGP
jgi:hypothetical protein